MMRAKTAFLGLLAGILIWAAVAFAANVFYAVDRNFPPGDATSNGAYSDIYYNKMAALNSGAKGIYQRYSSGSKTRIKNDTAQVVDISGSAIRTQAWCQNPSGPGGSTTFAAQCMYTNTAP